MDAVVCVWMEGAMMEDAVRASAGEVSDNSGGHAGSTGMSTQGVAVLMGQRFEKYGKLLGWCTSHL